MNLQGLPMGEAVAKTDEAFKSLKLPPDYSQSLQGQAKEMGKMMMGFLTALALSLFLAHQQLTIFSIMGIFMLFGIVNKKSILIVDYSNSLRAKGLPRDAAIMEANKTRLRTILMTTIVLVAAMLPVALGKGPGSSSRARHRPRRRGVGRSLRFAVRWEDFIGVALRELRGP